MNSSAHDDLMISFATPDAAQFKTLRDDCGWGKLPLAHAQAALLGSLMTVSHYDGKTLVGFGRAVGDGILNVYIQDVIVSPLYRGRGLGDAIVQKLISRLTRTLPESATVGLLAARGKAGFYTRHGFQMRPGPTTDGGMSATAGRLLSAQTAMAKRSAQV